MLIITPESSECITLNRLHMYITVLCYHNSLCKLLVVFKLESAVLSAVFSVRIVVERARRENGVGAH